MSSDSKRGVIPTRPLPETSNIISRTSLFLSASFEFGARTGRISNRSQARVRAFSRASSESTLLPMGTTLRMQAPPAPADEERRGAREHEPCRQAAGCPDQETLGDVTSDESEAHPRGRPHGRDQQPAVSFALATHGRPSITR